MVSERACAARDGVVFLDAKGDLLEHRNWASRLAESVEGTVAVVNRTEIEANAK